MQELITGASVPAIAFVVYVIIELIKHTTNRNEKVMRLLPMIATVIGLAGGIVCFYFVPNIIPTNNVVVALLIGAASGLTATGFNQIIKQAKK